jgi:hypothetical protein
LRDRGGLESPGASHEFLHSHRAGIERIHDHAQPFESPCLPGGAASLLPARSPRTQKSIRKEWIAYIGTYTRQKSKASIAYNFAPATGGITPIGLVAETINLLAIHPNKKFVYAANEVIP